MRIFILLGLIAAISCSKKNKEEAVVMQDGKTYELGTVLPELRNTSNDTIFLALYPHARMFYLNRKLKNSALYLQIINDAVKAGKPVKARIFKRDFNGGSEEVAAIYKPTAAELSEFNTHFAP